MLELIQKSNKTIFIINIIEGGSPPIRNNKRKANLTLDLVWEKKAEGMDKNNINTTIIKYIIINEIYKKREININLTIHPNW